MRVMGAGKAEGERRRAEARRSFDAALTRVREGREARRGDAERARPRGREGPTSAKVPPAAATSPPAAGSPSGLERSPAAAAATAGQPGAEPALPELREAARAIPPAIWAGKLEGAAAVELAFGRELAVELRQGAAGIEIAVRTAPALARAARVDLPALVRSLRARGIAVARAQVCGEVGGTARIRTGE